MGGGGTFFDHSPKPTTTTKKHLKFPGYTPTILTGSPFSAYTALKFPFPTSSPAPLLSFFFGFRGPALVRYLRPGSECGGRAGLLCALSCRACLLMHASNAPVAPGPLRLWCFLWPILSWTYSSMFHCSLGLGFLDSVWYL